MSKIFPKKLKVGDEIRIIAPSRSIKLLSQETKDISNKRFEDLGFKLSFGKHVDKTDEFNSSNIELRVGDW